MTASRREAVGIKQEALHGFKALDATISSRTLKTRKVSRLVGRTPVSFGGNHFKLMRHAATHDGHQKKIDVTQPSYSCEIF